MYRIYFINHFYYSSREFGDFDSAKAYAQSTGFECRIDRGNEVIASYSPLRGWNYRQQYRWISN